MKLVQVYNQDEKQYLLMVERELTDEQIEGIIRYSSNFEEEEDAEEFLESYGIHRTFIDLEINL